MDAELKDAMEFALSGDSAGGERTHHTLRLLANALTATQQQVAALRHIVELIVKREFRGELVRENLLELCTNAIRDTATVAEMFVRREVHDAQVAHSCEVERKLYGTEQQLAAAQQRAEHFEARYNEKQFEAETALKQRDEQWQRAEELQAKFEKADIGLHQCKVYRRNELRIAKDQSKVILEEKQKAQKAESERDAATEEARRLREALAITQRTYTGGFDHGYIISITGHEMRAIQSALATTKGDGSEALKKTLNGTTHVDGEEMPLVDFVHHLTEERVDAGDYTDQNIIDLTEAIRSALSKMQS